MSIVFTDKDRQELAVRGITEEQILAQIEIFKGGIPPAKLIKPCTVGDGITVISKAEKNRLIELCQGAAASGRTMKFVPASGAATRMFHLLLAIMHDYPDLKADRLEKMAEEGNKDIQQFLLFFRDLKKFAFYDSLKAFLEKRGSDIERLIDSKQYKKILSALLDPEGMNYANLAKGLIKFHKYETDLRTPFEEQLIEAAAYTRDEKRIARLHFTVSPPSDSENDEISYIEYVRKRYEKQQGIRFEISYSTQKKSTDTIAVDHDNRPLHDADGALHFRPGGHGALLENLNELRGDIIFIKNIDNVVPDRLKPETYRYKMLLGGFLVNLQNEMFGYLEKLTSGEVDDALLAELFQFAEKQLSIVIPREIENGTQKERVEFLINRFNRPLRVCGMVKNQGEPGGGPFWVELPADTPSLQIVESSQLDKDDPEQLETWNSSTHFNPVDLVCGVRDFRGEPFDLMAFRDPHGGFISRKSKNGKEVKALELPGLWNGSMAFWNTVFVEVPITTFNPVKTVFDLLRDEHQPE